MKQKNHRVSPSRPSSPSSLDGNNASESTNPPVNKRKLKVVSVIFQEGPLGLRLKETRSCGGAVIITGFSRGEGDQLLQAEACGKLEIGMIMLSVGGEIVFGRPFDEVCFYIWHTDAHVG